VDNQLIAVFPWYKQKAVFNVLAKVCKYQTYIVLQGSEASYFAPIAALYPLPVTLQVIKVLEIIK